jgi:uncharacterized protein
MHTSILQRIRELARARTPGADPAHDFAHAERVTANARLLGAAEGADLDILLPAALLHELFNYPKNHPESSRSGEVCAGRASELLDEMRYPASLIPHIADCIRDHGFSRGIVPGKLEGRLLQDADRLDAIGAIGIARCFATCATMQTLFYNVDDPFCRARDPDDRRWGVDHFYRKLLRIPATLHTEAARRMAAPRIAFLEEFLRQLEREISPPAVDA